MSKPRSKKHNALVRCISKLHMSELYSDMKVKSREKMYHVHRAIVCPQSAWFEAACGENFKEAEDGLIDLPEEDPQAVDIMIWQFYHQDYSVMPHEPVTVLEGEESHDQVEEASKSGDDDCALLVHVKVYALAEKLRVMGLKGLALRKFREAAGRHWASEVFLAAVQEAYETIPEPDRQLRTAILDTIHEHRELLDISTARESLSKVDGLPWDILMHFHDKSKESDD